jgi:hypothetical protein
LIWAFLHLTLEKAVAVGDPSLGEVQRAGATAIELCYSGQGRRDLSSKVEESFRFICWFDWVGSLITKRLPM